MRPQATVESMNGAAGTGLQVAQHDIDPAEIGQVTGMSSAGENMHVAATCSGHRTEEGQAIREHRTA